MRLSNVLLGPMGENISGYSISASSLFFVVFCPVDFVGRGQLPKQALFQTLAWGLALRGLQMCLLLSGLIFFEVVVIHVYLCLVLLQENFSSDFQVWNGQFSEHH